MFRLFKAVNIKPVSPSALSGSIAFALLSNWIYRAVRQRDSVRAGRLSVFRKTRCGLHPAKPTPNGTQAADAPDVPESAED